MADVITGEAVALDLRVATFPSRVAALLLDMLVQFVLLLMGLFLAGAASALGGDYGPAAFVVILVLALVGYPTAFETLSRGKTLGKMALGIRVVGDDGSPERFRQALVRALVGVFEIWSFVLAPVALITSIISARGKRVGDVFAGTYVIQERAPARRPLPSEYALVPPPLAGWAPLLEVSRLSDQTAEAAGSYLRRFAELTPQARDALGIQIANAVAAQVSPPPPAGTPPAAYLSAVLAVRRQREWERFMAMQPAPPAPPVPAPPVPAPPVSSAPVSSPTARTTPITPAPPQAVTPPEAVTSTDTRTAGDAESPTETRPNDARPTGFVPPA